MQHTVDDWPLMHDDHNAWSAALKSICHRARQISWVAHAVTCLCPILEKFFNLAWRDRLILVFLPQGARKVANDAYSGLGSRLELAATQLGQHDCHATECREGKGAWFGPATNKKS